MLTDIKNRLAKNERIDSVSETMTDKINDDEDRDVMLDDIDLLLVEAETDSDVAKLVDDVPEYDGEEMTEDDLDSLEESFIPETTLEGLIKHSGPSGKYGVITKIASLAQEPLAKFLQTLISEPLFNLIHGNVSKMTDVESLERLHVYAKRNKEDLSHWAAQLKVLPGYRVAYDLGSEWWEEKEKEINKRLGELKKK